MKDFNNINVIIETAAKVAEAEKHLNDLMHMREYTIIDGIRIYNNTPAWHNLVDYLDEVEIFDHVNKDIIEEAKEEIRRLKDVYAFHTSLVRVYKYIDGIKTLISVHDAREKRVSDEDEYEYYYCSDLWFEDGYEAGYISY